MTAVPHTKDSPSDHSVPPVREGGDDGASSSAAIQPAPAIVDTSSHAAAHVFPRRFLGPMPLREATSTKANEKREAFRELRRKAMHRLLKAKQGNIGVDEGFHHPRLVHHFRVRKKTLLGDETELNFAVDDTGSSSESSDEEAPMPKKKKDKDKKGKGKTKDKTVGKKDKKKDTRKKKKKKKKGPGDVWVGNSFDIGAEFESVPRGDKDGREPSTPASVLGEDMQDSPEIVPHELHQEDEGSAPTAGPSKPLLVPLRPTMKSGHPSRAGSTSSTGGETFVTARDGAEDSDGSTFHAVVPDPPRPPPSDGQQSAQSSPKAGASSQGDSRACLIHSSDEETDLGPSNLSPRQSETRHRSRGGSIASTARDAKHAINARLKSALRPEAHEYSDMERPHRSKTVQFTKTDDVMPSGARAPVHPGEVLARSGSDVEGTSADGADDAVLIDDDVLPGGIVMRDRACVKVGRHRDESIANFDEATQRRSPCYRVDPMEEYVIGMTVTSIDFYLDWVSYFALR